MKELIPGEEDSFSVVLLGIIFDPAKKQVLIEKKENNGGWGFMEIKANPGERLEDSLKKRIRERAGYGTEILGCIFSSIHPEKRNLILMHYLCEVTKAEKANRIPRELKWVKPEELREYFAMPFEPDLEEYIINLK